MITINEQRTIRAIHSKPDISLREIVEELDLGGVASASHIINSLEKKGYLRRVGVATSKRYELTNKALAFEEVINMAVVDLTPRNSLSEAAAVDSSIEHRSTSSESTEKFPQFWSGDFPSGSSDTTGKNLGTFLSSSFTKILSSPVGLQKYGDLIVMSVLSVFLVLPTCHFLLKDQWLVGFVLTEMFLLVLIILNKK